MQIFTDETCTFDILAFSRDGRWLLSISLDNLKRSSMRWKKEARLYDLANGKLFWSHSDNRDLSIRGAAFTPDGQRLLTLIGSATNRFLELETLSEIDFVLEDDLQLFLRTPIFSPSGEWVLAQTSMGDLRGESVNRWLLMRYPSFEFQPLKLEFRSRPFEGLFCSLPTFSFDGKYFSLICNNVVYSYDLTTCREISQFPYVRPNYGRAICAFDPRSNHLAVVSGNKITLHEIKTGTLVATIVNSGKSFQEIAFTPDGKFLGTVNRERTVKMWSTDTWELVKEYDWQIDYLRCIAFSNDGLMAATCGGTGKIVVWDLEDL